MTEQRPPACLNDEAVLRWLLAERDWLLGPVALAQHQIRIREGAFEHDAVQRAADRSVDCTDPWHYDDGAPYQCPTCGYWMGEGIPPV